MIDSYKLGKFLSDGKTWKIVEVMYALDCSWDELVEKLEELSRLGLVEYGGYTSDPENIKFVRALKPL